MVEIKEPRFVRIHAWAMEQEDGELYHEELFPYDSPPMPWTYLKKRSAKKFSREIGEDKGIKLKPARVLITVEKRP